MGTEDEATFGLIPIICRGWARKGSNPAVLINHKNEYTNVFAARTKRRFVYSFSKRKRQREFVKFLNKLIKRWGRVLLFIDSAPGHKGKILDKFCYEHRKVLKLIRFPVYTPELNPTEQCWKPARKALANRILLSLPAAKYHLRKTFSDSKFMPKMFDYLGD